MDEVNIDTPIPSGSWTLYFHSPEENKWGINTFKNVATVTTWKDFWSLINTIKNDILIDGMFFWMRNQIPPLWENHQNIRGGGYSFRISKKDSIETFIQYTIATMLNKVTIDSSNKINGISISPKKGFNIIKLWNTDCQKFNKQSDLEILTSTFTTTDIMYTPFIQKKM
jgi:hypothetical protein